MGFFSWIVFGGLAGWLASIIMGKNKSMGLFANILVGVIGASIGGVIIGFFGGAGVTGFNVRSLAVAVVGAVTLLTVLNRFGRK